ncbi:MAG: dephospho-CoA kinase [Dehalococcoidia bacterium]|nr:dephospho-CoA kinase [Dehalococcoidia bacterium]
MRVVGLTGGIGSGKSTIVARLAELGAAVIDVDRVAHSTYRRGKPAYDRLTSLFGPGIVGNDGEIDRTALGAAVFGDAGQMKKLTGVVWPATHEASRERLKEEEARGAEVVVVEAAVLVEAKWMDVADEIWVATTPPELAIARIVSRNGISEEQARERIASQLSNEERMRYADVVIVNDGTIAELIERVDRCWDDLLARIAAGATPERR